MTVANRVGNFVREEISTLERRLREQEIATERAQAELRHARRGCNVVMVNRDGSERPQFIEGADHTEMGCYPYRPPYYIGICVSRHSESFTKTSPAASDYATITYRRTDRKDELGRIIYEEQ